MLTVRSLFSGLGAFEVGLENAGIQFDLKQFCEIDKYAIKAYCLIHGEPTEKNIGDISKVDVSTLGYVDLITYGFPCQDVSVAGKQKGIIKGETRSGCLYYALEDIRVNQPKYAICENVKNLVGKQFKADFENMLKELDEMGYNSYWKILNAKDFEIPQNRERVFVVSIRKDIDKGFEFPKAVPLSLKLKDLLEDDVDDKFYISEEKTKKLIDQLTATTVGCNPCLTPDRIERRQVGRRFKEDGDPAFTLNTQDRHGVLMQVGMLDMKGNEQVRRVYDAEGLSPTLNTMQGGNRQPKVIENYRIRRLTPKECFRLMNFEDSDYQVLKANGISDSQLYKMAGNSIVTSVTEAIFRELFKGE